MLSDRFLSRQHARFYRDGDSWVVEDLGSRNTTLLNGRPLATPVRLSLGDLVKLSETVISVEGFDAASSKPKSDASAKTSSSDTIVLRSASELIATAERESAGRLKLLNEVHRALATCRGIRGRHRLRRGPTPIAEHFAHERLHRLRRDISSRNHRDAARSVAPSVEGPNAIPRQSGDALLVARFRACIT